MLKVLKVPETSPLLWQTSLIDSEVDSILEGANLSRERGKSPPKSGGAAREFLRRGCGRTSAGGNRASDGSSTQGLTERKEMKRLEIAPGDICPVCQEDIREIDEEGTSLQGVRAGQLTFCRDGCGNNLHTRCMLMYAEHRRSSGEKVCCPLCRIDWSTASVRALREAGSSCGDRFSNSRQAKNLPLQTQNQEQNQNQNQDPDQNQNQQQPTGLVGHQEIYGTARPVPITCRACKIKIRATFYRCLLCQPPGSWDLCARCFTGVRATSRRGPCKITGRRRHPFVQGEASTFPPDWKPARSPDPREAPSNRRAAADIMRSLQGREITTGDFELLLGLDASSTPPLHEHLLGALPVYGDSVFEGEIESAMEAGEHARPSGRLAPFPPATSGSSELTPRALRGTAEESCSEVGSSSSNATHRAANRAWDQVVRETIASSHQPARLALSGLTPTPDPGIAPPGPTCCYCSPLETRLEISGKADTIVEDARRLLRRLPCGHYAHDACLIPNLLEGLGRGDPALCSCPIDGSTVFPALERRLVLASNPSSRRRLQASTRRGTANSDDHGLMAEETVGPRSDVSETGVVRSSLAVPDSALALRGEASACGKVNGEDMRDIRMMLIGEGLRQSLHAHDPSTESPSTDRDRCGDRRIDRRIRARRRPNVATPKTSRDSGTIGVAREGGDGVDNGAGGANDCVCNDIEGIFVEGRGTSSDWACANAIRRGQVRGRRSSCERARPRRSHEEVRQKTLPAETTPASEVRDKNGAFTVVEDDELSSFLTSSRLTSKKSNRRVPIHRTASDDVILASPGARDRIRTLSAI